MSPLRLTASQWVEKYRRGIAATSEGRRRVVARDTATGVSAYVEVEVEEPDLRCAVVDGRLDAADIVRTLSIRHG
jgi:hypothetical protein